MLAASCECIVLSLQVPFNYKVAQLKDEGLESRRMDWSLPCQSWMNQKRKLLVIVSSITALFKDPFTGRM